MSNTVDTSVFYDRLKRWGGEISAADRERIEATLRLIPPEVKTILDVGCGDGAVTNALIERGVAVTGVDFSRTALQYFEGPKIVGSVDSVPFGDRAFDLVLCAEVLEHLPAGVFEATVRELERVAAKWIVVTTPNEEYLPAGLCRCPACETRFHVNRHVRTFDREGHRSLCSNFACEESVGMYTWRHDRLMIGVQQRLFGVFAFRERLVCPCCAREVPKPPQRSVPARALLKGAWLLRKLGPEPVKARWLGSRFRRLDAPTA